MIPRRGELERAGEPRLRLGGVEAERPLAGEREKMLRRQRELLRSEIDRRKRERLGERSPMDGWVTLPEASGIVGIKATKLRLKVNALGIETIRCANRKLIRVEAWRRPVGRRRS